MNIDLFFKKIYTVAFRLTGEEEIAEEISSQAIVHTFKEINEDYKATENMVHLAVFKVIEIFLGSPNSHYNENLKGSQRALMELKPMNRVTVIWKDVLGYKINDNIPVSDYTYDELYKELASGRKKLKEFTGTDIR